MFELFNPNFMINKAAFSAIKNQYPFLSSLPDKLQELISDQISPDDQINSVKKVSIGGKDGCLILLGNKAVACWMSRFLFKKFPTVQEFHFAQINQLNEVDSKGLFIHASADPEKPNEDYEEGGFVFDSANERNEAERLIRGNAPRIQ